MKKKNKRRKIIPWRREKTALEEINFVGQYFTLSHLPDLKDFNTAEDFKWSTKVEEEKPITPKLPKKFVKKRRGNVQFNFGLINSL